MKKGLIILIVMALFSMVGCSNKLKVVEGDKGLDEVIAQIQSISAKKNENTGYTLIEAKVKLTGNSDKGAVAIHGKYHFLDSNDNEVDTSNFYYIRVNKAIEKGETIIVEDGFQDKLEGEIKKVYLEITDVTNPLEIFAEDKSRGSDYGD